MISTLALYRIRYGAYGSLFFWNFLLFILCCVRLAYTGTRRGEKSLNNGDPFYDPSVAELLFTSIVTLIWISVLIFAVRRKVEHVVVTRVWFEILMLALLWFFWLGGASAASTQWPDLSFCVQYVQCRDLQALMAFAWLGWISLTVLVAVTILFVVKATGSIDWQRHVHAEWANGISSGTSPNQPNMSMSNSQMYSFSASPHARGGPSAGSGLSSFKFPVQKEEEEMGATGQSTSQPQGNIGASAA